jgi:hypothetical protein
MAADKRGLTRMRQDTWCERSLTVAGLGCRAGALCYYSKGLDPAFQSTSVPK